MTDVAPLLRGGLERCARIVAGCEELIPFLAPVLPIQDDDLARLPVIERIASIALLKRYEQLQDMIGRLFRTYLSWEGEDVRDMSRRDHANRMERYHLIGDADDWMDFLDLRNRLVHEYPVNEVEQVDRVNECWAAIPRLTDIYDKLRQRLSEQGFHA